MNLALLFADPEAAARKIIELAKAIKTIQDGRIYIEEIAAPFLHQLKGTTAEYKAGLNFAVAKSWLDLHESGRFVRLTKSGKDVLMTVACRSNRSRVRIRPRDRQHHNDFLNGICAVFAAIPCSVMRYARFDPSSERSIQFFSSKIGITRGECGRSAALTQPRPRSHCMN